MAKRPSLAETMRQAVTPTALEGEGTPEEVPDPGRATHAAGYYAATRAGKKKVTASLSPQAHKQLRQLGLDRDMTVEALLAEAINDLFKKHGCDAIA
jgi:hypothetical protein